MNDELYARLRAYVRGETLRDEPMARHTSLKVGGAADFFVIPADRDDLAALLALLAETGTPYLVVGGGYNLLVRDGGIRGVVISLARLDEMTLLAGEKVMAGAGVTNRQLVQLLRDRGLGGLEFLCGIPGTVGGALAMNAGAHGGAVVDRVEELLTIRDGEMLQTGRDGLDYGYRFLRLAPGEIIVGATFRLDPADPDQIGVRIAGYLEHRAASQKVGFPNAGSFFKNPEGTAAWRLIDEAGLRGERVGGAQVSEAHANFLINRGRATAADFLALATRIKEAVKQRTGIALEEEVRIVGEG
ncbi:UDP-N-acetylmuramate dehydrogenase [Geobacter hydrogenophilus]|uniref:UDP-N-acetylenolpyruvoylglucosamine reductase n=1 Tax=Geobacter hydrogenophilus TaxID=40983 RepID=A0A9W6G106_9BACT|nr:UDP-N-acetylmuramate dehydrogenase [Geobacter hydrogenophilus]MBT0894260.1 UDP-N-acetylmuramate dehydrogenase [Geobacter hydrogenophilus]GLI38454.1 UDP-N-acetylenolpyruvoylglucosamine reductase [Geobacter hydrogenophilus]